jgi:hypothetical protein
MILQNPFPYNLIHAYFLFLCLVFRFKCNYVYAVINYFKIHVIPPFQHAFKKVAYTIEYYLLPFVASQSSAVVAVCHVT